MIYDISFLAYVSSPSWSLRRAFSFREKQARPRPWRYSAFCPHVSRVSSGLGHQQDLGMTFKTFEDVLDHLDHLGLFHMDFELNRMRAGLESLGLVRQETCRIVQVVGTNGKGSTSTFLASLARTHGLKVGLYTSPHFLTPRERIRINERMLEPELWPALANKVMEAAPDLTYFEFLTALGLLAFREADVDLVVMEAGLGGRYDATTAMPVHGVCFVPIDLDHQKILGSTITAIAMDKAQAMRPGIPAYTAPQSPEALRVLQDVAGQKGVPLMETESLPLPTCPLGLAGPHQRSNARTALAVWNDLAARFGWAVRNEAIAAGLANARLAGRFQSLNNLDGLPPVILDGAHNPHGLRSLVSAMDDAGLQPSAVIFSCLGDKAMDDMLPLVGRVAGNSPIFLPTIQDNERAISGEILAERLRETRTGRTEAVQRLSAALSAIRKLDPPASPEHPVLVCGSLYLLGEFFTLYPEALELPDSSHASTHADGPSGQSAPKAQNTFSM